MGARRASSLSRGEEHKPFIEQVFEDQVRELIDRAEPPSRESSRCRRPTAPSAEHRDDADVPGRRLLRCRAATCRSRNAARAGARPAEPTRRARRDERALVDEAMKKSGADLGATPTCRPAGRSGTSGSTTTAYLLTGAASSPTPVWTDGVAGARSSSAARTTRHGWSAGTPTSPASTRPTPTGTPRRSAGRGAAQPARARTAPASLGARALRPSTGLQPAGTLVEAPGRVLRRESPGRAGRRPPTTAGPPPSHPRRGRSGRRTLRGRLRTGRPLRLTQRGSRSCRVRSGRPGRRRGRGWPRAVGRLDPAEQRRRSAHLDALADRRTPVSPSAAATPDATSARPRPAAAEPVAGSSGMPKPGTKTRDSTGHARRRRTPRRRTRRCRRSGRAGRSGRGPARPSAAGSGRDRATASRSTGQVEPGQAAARGVRRGPRRRRGRGRPSSAQPRRVVGAQRARA